MIRTQNWLTNVSLVGALALAACSAGDLEQETSELGGPPAFAGKFVERDVLIQFEPGATDAEKAEARALVGAVHSEPVRTSATEGDLELARVPPGHSVSDAVHALHGHGSVSFAEPNFLYGTDAVSDDTYFTGGSLWGMYGDASAPANQVNQYGSQASEAWAAGHTGSSSVYVGIIDTGVMFAHSDLDANMWDNPFDAADGIDNDGNGYVDDTRGWDFDGNNKTTYDGTQDNHGTHVAGTIGAERNGAGVVGVNWNVTVITAKFLGRAGGTTANAIKAVDYFTDLKTRHGLNIVATNNSWGGGGFSQGLLEAIERANVANILFVAAASNEGTNNDTAPVYPGSYANANIISVAALTSTGGLASFSNFGATTVDIGAPGSNINSSIPGKQGASLYGSKSGTSMAAPHVTGAVALYASTRPGLSAAALKDAILSSAVPTTSLAGKCVTGGRLNASAF